MDSSFSGVLRINGFEWPVMATGKAFHQLLGQRGAPNSKVRSEGVWVMLDGSGSDTHFFKESLLAQPESLSWAGELVFVNSGGQTKRHMQFEEGRVGTLHTVFEPGRQDGLPALLTLLHIAAPVWFIDGVRHPYAPDAAPPRQRPSAKPDKPSPPDLKCQAVFSRKMIYAGEFGFDWLEWKKGTETIEKVQQTPVASFQYAFDDTTRTYQPVATHPALLGKLRREYQRLSVYGNPYFVPWLSLKPGQTVNLLLTTQFLNQEALKQDYLTFAPNPAYEVSVNGQINEAIRLTPNDGSAFSVSIKCLRPGPATALVVKDELGTTVGQINVVENQYVYKLPLRVVYLVKEGPTKAAQVAKLQAKFSAHRPGLEAYLTKASFNQALIECTFEKPAAPHVFAFKPDQWAKDGHYDPRTNKLKDSSVVEDLLPYVSEKVNKARGFHGVTIYLTDLEFQAGNYGFGRLFPTSMSDVILFPEGLAGTRTFAHEIGHVLGLQHSFLNPGTLASIKAAGSDNTKKLLAMQEEYVKTLKKGLLLMKPGSAEARQQQEYIASTEQSIRVLKQQQLNDQAAQESYAKNKLLFTQAATENVMDYYNEDRSFWHWQWQLMQQEVVRFYGVKTSLK